RDPGPLVQRRRLAVLPEQPRVLRRLLETCPEIDSLFASNDQMALGAIQTAHRLGRRIPDDLAVVGFDNIPESAYFWPALTTVSQPLVELGHAAVQELSQMIDADQRDSLADTSKSILLKPELIVRESTPRAATQP
ncbi:MAG TPA: substrate-binding domain-containing protein, partial [Anaerolineales bacterium]